MGFLDRITSILRSNLNDLINRAEDPEKVLETTIQDMREQLVEAKKRVAMAITHEKRLAQDIERHRKEAAEWEGRAMSAVRSDRDDLALKALEKKKAEDAITGDLERQHADQAAAVAQLKVALAAIKERIDEATRRKNELVMRNQRAQAARAAAETLAVAASPRALDTIERMNDKIDRAEAEALAQLEVAGLVTATTDDPLAAEFRRLEAETHPAHDDLLELKRKMKLLEAPKTDSDEP